MSIPGVPSLSLGSDRARALIAALACLLAIAGLAPASVTRADDATPDEVEAIEATSEAPEEEAVVEPEASPEASSAAVVTSAPPIEAVAAPEEAEASAAEASDEAEAAEEEEAAEPLTLTSQLWDRLISVELHGAIDGPIGVFGGTLVISPIRNLALELGGGVSRDGGRFAGGLRLVLPQDHFGLLLRLGVAAGPLTWDATAETSALQPYRVHRRWDFQAGFYSDVGFQHRFDFGLTLGAHIGVEGSLSNTADTCSVLDQGPGVPSACSPSGFRPIRVYAGLQVGYAFDIRM